MKIQINGFEIELDVNDANLSIKVSDASGKELSNNSYSNESVPTEVEPVEIKSPEEVEASTVVEPTQTEESLIPTLESIKNGK